MITEPADRPGPAAPPTPSTPPVRPARIDPLPLERWTPELRGLLAGSAKDGPGRVNLFGTLAHHPELARAWLSLARVLTHDGTLSARRRELVVLCTAHRRGGSFVYDRHGAVAADAGLDSREVAATALPLGAHPWAEDELAPLEAADALAAVTW